MESRGAEKRNAKQTARVLSRRCFLCRRSLDPLPTTRLFLDKRSGTPLANEIPSPDEKLHGQIPPPRARRMQAIRVTPASGDDTSSPHTGETPTDYSHATLAGCVATRGHAARDIPTPTVFAPDARA